LGITIVDSNALQNGVRAFAAYALDDVIVAGAVDGGRVRPAAAIQTDGFATEIDGLIICSRRHLDLVTLALRIDCSLDGVEVARHVERRSRGGAHQSQHKHTESKVLYERFFLQFILIKKNLFPGHSPNSNTPVHSTIITGTEMKIYVILS
jgi:hypothetical protein